MKINFNTIVDVVVAHGSHVEGPNARVQVCSIVKERDDLFFVDATCFRRVMAAKRFYSVQVADGLISTEEFSSDETRRAMSA